MIFFVNHGSQIIELVKAVTESIKAIASGSVGAVAKAIEGALAKSVPVLIGFLASLLGIGGLVGKVQNIIKKIRKRIDKAIDKLLLKAKKAAKKLIKKGKKTATKVKKTAESAFNKLFDKKTKFTTDTGESHSVYYQDKGDKAVLMVAISPKSIEDFLIFYQREYRVNSQKIKPIKAFIKTDIKPLKTKLTKAHKKNKIKQVKSLQQQLLDKNVELSQKLKTLMSRNKDVGETINIYSLEGLTGTYSSIPQATKDCLTPDHQPQAAILEWAANQSFFGTTSNMAKRAARRAKQGYAINLHETRHRAGRTYGGKGTATKNKFIATVKDNLKGVTTNQEKRNITVDLIKDELREDVNEMKKVINKKENWSDINALAIPAKEKTKLINTIKNNIDRGEQQMLNQDLESLKK